MSNWNRARTSLSWIALSAILTATPAASQSSTPSKPPPAQTEKKPPALPRQPEPPKPGDDAVQNPEDLADKLKRNKGVIRPPAGIDPDIRKPAPVPDPGTARVVPPPVSPGGKSDIRPE